MKPEPEDVERLDMRYDWVGPADPISKIRPIRLRRVENESESELLYREAREDLNEWNSRFWTEHNQLFERRKREFYANRRKMSGSEEPSANDLSLFYKDFLNEQANKFSVYNNEWYRRNLRLIWPAMRVSWVRFRRFLGRPL
ncbi:hypothetical protein DdX_15673 [Ditylenchus destructor]|uniref:Uncharacterized protein n=1 Tax=Ditylenchus destructor TaxID=166010 RepID=A0AAD4MRV5_9BILA|nr:hypothetical protein DdX_15673 [Ditylenchus destructor]